MTKENAEEPNPNRTPSREIGLNGLDGVRQAAKGDPRYHFRAASEFSALISPYRWTRSR